MGLPTIMPRNSTVARMMSLIASAAVTIAADFFIERALAARAPGPRREAIRWAPPVKPLKPRGFFDPKPLPGCLR